MTVTICDRCGNVAKSKQKVVINDFLEKKEEEVLYVTSQNINHCNGISFQTKDLCQNCYDKYKILVNNFFRELSE